MIDSHSEAQQLNKRLSISCVTYSPDSAMLLKVLQDLIVACACLENIEVKIFLIDNGPDKCDFELLKNTVGLLSDEWVPKIKLISGHGNVGFGRGHNLALKESDSDYHLIINPDLYVEEKALSVGLDYLLSNREAFLVVPAAKFLNGEVQYISKRYPGLLVLFLRGFAPAIIRRWSQRSIGRYEYRDFLPATEPVEVDLASGCFMLARTSALREVFGFDEKFFMYFEDFDLSIRLREKGGKIVHLPAMKVRHLGGNSAKKGIKHICYFTASAFKFFNKHGWSFL